VWSSGDNANGELGNGTYASSNVPVQGSGLSGITAVASGVYSSLALRSDGSMWAWGLNEYGELGNGTYNNTNDNPAQVLGLSDVIAIAGGAYHYLAVRSDGSAWAWGENTFGGLGIGTTQDYVNNVPAQVLGLSGVTAVAGGGHHSLALKSDGSVWAWGWNVRGQLGNGTGNDSDVPVQVPGLSGVTAIAAGSEHSLAVRSDGSVWAWGLNEDGQLGNGTTIDSSIPVQVSGLSGVTAIAAGWEDSLAVRSDGTAWAWGDNTYGELGNGTSINSSIPVRVSGLSGVTAVASNCVSLTATAGGAAHSLAVTSDGSVWGWGYNGYGELGDGTNTTSNVPVLSLLP
jgi:alpha-tubulin suppressor-like RCC1 family protein